MMRLFFGRVGLVGSLLLFIVNFSNAASIKWPANLPGKWSSMGRATIQTTADSALIQGGYAATGQSWDDAKISFRTRAPVDAKEVQLWAGFRFRDRDSRYVFALRGGNDNDLYLARYAPDGGAKFLGFAPLDFKPEQGVWYRLTVEALGNRIQIYLNDEKLPRLNVVDSDASWTAGGVLLGGGWLPAEFADLQVSALSGEDKETFSRTGDNVWTAPVPDKEGLRRIQRSEYQPARLAAFAPQRTVIALDGKWLFEPDYQLRASQKPNALDFDDTEWHVMKVPEFWTPGLSWLHGETGFPDLKGPAMTKGVAESLYVEELRRADAYTFDWRKTRSAWYRHYLELPDDLKDRHFELTFDAIAKISEIWVNGAKVGAHTGLFGEVKCDVTSALTPGRNVIAVHVIGQLESTDKTSGVEGVAVTVEVTSKMLHSLAHGMLQDHVAGIWQPVRLTASSPSFVNDVFIEPGLHGADVMAEVLNKDTQQSTLNLDYEITTATNGAVLYRSKEPISVVVKAGETNHVSFSTPYLRPKLWSPAEPNLYNLNVVLKRGQTVVDRYTVRFGFRTFTKNGAEFLLNGRPYWLRGADPFPNTLRPNDSALAHRFMELAHDGNVAVTRSHIIPFTSTWLDAADETGMAVSFEGTWPWLMLKGGPPDPYLLKAWKDEFLSLIRQDRNHPSLILWTVNNEMNLSYNDVNDPAMVKKKWAVVDDMIKAMRKADPTRLIVADSNYVRKQAAKSYHGVVEPNHFDDGDIDDAHRYYGWYNETFFHLYDGQFGEQLSTPGRPLISQEMATGYPNNDDGHPTRFYLFKHETPQALVGDDAYENANPAIFLNRQAFITKELAETFRRADRSDVDGILHFAYFTWFLQPWSLQNIKPGPAYYGLKEALQPVLVSAELFGRHFYAGSTIHRRVCIANDAENGKALPASDLIWEVQQDGNTLARGKMKVPYVKYYTNVWLDANIVLPETLPAPRVDAQLVFKLKANGKIISENSYDIVVATKSWADGGDKRKSSNIVLIDPYGKTSDVLADVALTKVASMDAVKGNKLLIVGDTDSFISQPAEIGKLREFVSRGGRVLLLHPESFLTQLCPDKVKAYRSKKGEIATMHIPESPVFAGIEPLDLAWFERGGRRLPMACDGVYQIAENSDTTALASQMDIHAYLQKPSDVEKYIGTPLVEIRIGKGRVVASEICFESGPSDPIARRLLSNVLAYLQ
jgi:beta-galactosidase